MLKSVATWFLMAAAVVGIPVDSQSEMEPRRATGPDTTVRNGFADFERLSSSGLAVKQIGYYGGLQWNGIAAVSAGDGGLLAGLRPASPTKVAAYGQITTPLLNGKPGITSTFSGSKTLSIGVKSFYFGCNGVTSAVPIGCKLAIAGYNKNGTQVAYQTTYFQPNSRLITNMRLTRLNPSFSSGLSYVRFATSYVGINVLGSTAFDNFKYSITVAS